MIVQYYLELKSKLKYSVLSVEDLFRRDQMYILCNKKLNNKHSDKSCEASKIFQPKRHFNEKKYYNVAWKILKQKKKNL